MTTDIELPAGFGTLPKYRAGQFVRKKRGETMALSVMIYELCPVPTPEGVWRYWYSYTAPSGQMHLAVADESEFTT